METSCFVASNTFTRTAELAPSIRTRVFFHPKRSPTQLHCKKVGVSTSISCCYLSWSSSPAGDDGQPHLEADWRSFRARLVANEQAFRLDIGTSSTVDLDTVVEVNHPLQVTIGHKWAHTIHEPEKGCLLIATEKLDGVHIFERTVILLLSVSAPGPYGVILNRPSLMSIKEMKTKVVDAAGMFSGRRLFFGGPLEEGLFLVSPERGYDNDMVEKGGVFEQVMKGLYYGTKENAGSATEMVKRNAVGIGDFRFFDGYCGWEKEQLREEIMAGYWKVAACSPSVIGLQNVGTHGLWEDILGLVNPEKVW